jgi:hypothetical protein
MPANVVLFSQTRASLPLPLEVGTRRKEGHALVHDRLANPEVVVDPLLDARCFGKLLRFYTGTVSARVSLNFVCLGCVWEIRWKVDGTRT